MNGVGIDTASLLVPVDPATAARIANALPLERHVKHGGSAHHYGNFRDWSATLHVRPRSHFAPSVLVVTASLPRLVYGENTRPVGTLGASEARARLFERVAAMCGVQLDPDDASVCRVDFCASFVPFAGTDAVIAAAARVELPRRNRAAMNNGVSFYARVAKETLYDKRNEVSRAIARTTRRATTDRGLAVELASLIRAERRLRRGALRLECRINGSKEVARRLKVAAAKPDLVLTTQNAAAVVGCFVAALGQRLGNAPGTEAALTLSRELGPVRGQRAFALLTLVALCGSIQVAASALGITAPAAARLVRLARLAGVGSIDLSGRPGRSPLALDAISVEGTDRFERRLLRTWRRTHQATSVATHNFSLSSAA